MGTTRSQKGPGFTDSILHWLAIPVLGLREATFRRVRRWVRWLAREQAAAWETSVEEFQRRHLRPDVLHQETGLSERQVEEYSHSSKVDSSTVAMMQKLVAQYSLSLAEGKEGSRVWAPAMIALALFTLDSSPRERDWRYLLYSALCKLIRQRGALEGEWDTRVALDAAYIVMLYTHLLPSAKAAARFARGIADELIQIRLAEAEDHFVATLPW